MYSEPSRNAKPIPNRTARESDGPKRRRSGSPGPSTTRPAIAGRCLSLLQQDAGAFGTAELFALVPGMDDSYPVATLHKGRFMINVEHMAAVLEALPDPAFVLTRSGRYVAVFGGRDTRYYHDGSGLVGLYVSDIVNPDKAGWFLEQIDRAAVPTTRRQGPSPGPREKATTSIGDSASGRSLVSRA